MAKNTNKTIIILREPNVQPPEAYLRKVLAACPNGGGYAVQTKNDAGEPELITDNMDTGASLDDVQELLKSYASHRVLLAFNKLEKVEEKFLQPYHVALDGDDVLLSFAIDGSFPSMVEAGNTEESLLAQRVMFPNIQKLIKFSAGDLDKFLSELRDPTFVDMVMSRIGDRGAFCFLPPVGDAIWLGKNTLGSTFPWGQTSDTLGYTEVSTATTVVADKKKGWWGKSKGPEVPVAQDPPVKEEPAAPASPPPVPLNIPADNPDTRITAPAKTPADTSAPPTEPPSGKWEAIPKGLSRDQRKKMVRRVTNCGSVLPDAWDKDPFYYFVPEYQQDEQMVKLAKAQEAKAVPKDMRAAAPRPAPSRGSEVDILMMSKDERSAIETHILNVLGYNAKNTQTPVEIQKMESIYPPFSKEFGIDFATFNGWTPKQLRLLGPKGLIHYALEARRKLIEGVAAGSPPVEATAPAVSSATAPAPKGYWGKKPKVA